MLYNELAIWMVLPHFEHQMHVLHLHKGGMQKDLVNFFLEPYRMVLIRFRSMILETIEQQFYICLELA